MNIQMVSQHQLSSDELSQLDVLMAQCGEQDKNMLPVYPNLLVNYRAHASNVLCYCQQSLVGFLSAYFFYEDACEIALMVAPQYRHKGLARSLLAKIWPLLDSMQMKKIYFSLPAGNDHNWLAAYGGEYRNSEYQMLRNTDKPVVMPQRVLDVRPVTHADLPILCTLDASCFAVPTPQSEFLFARLIEDPDYSLLLAAQSGVPVGKAHINWKSDEARLTDIAIMPRMQGKGLGRELMAYCIYKVLAQHIHDIHLDVETMNIRALSLYEHLEFKVVNAYDYWILPMSKDMCKATNKLDNF